MKGSLRERKPGVWELRVYLGRDPVTRKEKSVSRIHRGGKRTAQSALAKLVAEHSNGQKVTTETTLGLLLDEYMAVNGPGLAPNTHREYNRLIRQRIQPGVGHIELRKLEPLHLDRFYRSLLSSGLSAGSVRGVHAVIRVALNQGVRWGWLGVNVAQAATPPKREKTSIQPPTVDMARRLLAAADDHSPDAGLALRLAAVTGARRGELCGLRWSDIDRDRSVLTIRRSVACVDGGIVVKGTKTHSERELPLDLVTLERLRRHRLVQDERAKLAGVRVHRDGYVLSVTGDALRPRHPDTLTRVFTTLRKKVGAETVRLHDLRHAAATLMLDSGVSLHTVQKRLGHAAASTTLDIYGHPVDASDVVAADLLGRLMDGPQEVGSPGVLPLGE